MSPADKELLERLESIHKFASRNGEDTIFGDAVKLIVRSQFDLVSMTDTATRASKALDAMIHRWEADTAFVQFEPPVTEEVNEYRLTATYCNNMLP